jgi:hypothetical protein
VNILNLAILSACLLAASPVLAGDAAPGFEDAQRLCDAERCSLFTSLPAAAPEALAPLSMRAEKSYRTSGDGISLVDVGLGGLAGSIIGDEIGGPAEAVVFGLLGAGLALGGVGKDIDEEEARRRADAWRRGDDMVYNPAHPLPTVAHWLGPRKK